MMKINSVEKIIKEFDENLGVEVACNRDCYLYVSTGKHRYYIGYFNIDEIMDKRDLLFYLDYIKMREE